MKEFAAIPSVSLTNWRSELRDILPKLKVFAAELQSYFRQYLVCGGFPPAIGDLFRDGKVTENTEVKDQSSLAPSNYLTIKKSCKNGVVLTKDGFFDDEKILALPIACFLYCLA